MNRWGKKPSGCGASWSALERERITARQLRMKTAVEPHLRDRDGGGAGRAFLQSCPAASRAGSQPPAFARPRDSHRPPEIQQITNEGPIGGLGSANFLVQPAAFGFLRLAPREKNTHPLDSLSGCRKRKEVGKRASSRVNGRLNKRLRIVQ